jgi:hypothetical protein
MFEWSLLTTYIIANNLPIHRLADVHDNNIAKILKNLTFNRVDLIFHSNVVP